MSILAWTIAEILSIIVLFIVFFIGLRRIRKEAYKEGYDAACAEHNIKQARLIQLLKGEKTMVGIPRKSSKDPREGNKMINAEQTAKNIKVPMRNHDISAAISPSRKYIVIRKCKYSANPDRENIYEISPLPELYENTTWGARNYYLDHGGGEFLDIIVRIVPRELYLAEIQTKNDLAKATDQTTLTPYDQSRELVDKIKIALGNFYFIDHEVQDSEVLELLTRMMDEFRHFEVVFSKIQNDLNDAIRD